MNCTIKTGKKKFKHEHVWVIVKDDPKWQTVVPMPRSSKRTKNNESDAYTSSSNVDKSVRPKQDEVEVRPTGQKTAKEKGQVKEERESKGQW